MNDQQSERLKRIEREYKDAAETNDVRFLLLIITELQQVLPQAIVPTE